jgi:hypothetical protein
MLFAVDLGIDGGPVDDIQRVALMPQPRQQGK